MPSDNTITIASAGSGKTTAIVTDAEASNERSALVTYTVNSTAELKTKCYATFGFVPANIEVASWFSFLLRHFIRPYQREVYNSPIRKLLFVSGRSKVFAKESNTENYYFGAPGEILSDKISQFACKLIDETHSMPITRLERIFQRLYIDESQDLAGYDLELIERLLNSNIAVHLMGDHRQATYSTNSAKKNSAYRGQNIVKKFQEWHDSDCATLSYQNHSHRCVQPICDAADALFPDVPQTQSLNGESTNHDGLFVIPASHVGAYIEAYQPQTLRFSRSTKNVPGNPLNFGEAKGMTFERTLIFPHGKLLKYLKSGDLSHAGESLPKIYVGFTRAKQSVAFVVPDKPAEYIFPKYSEAAEWFIGNSEVCDGLGR